MNKKVVFNQKPRKEEVAEAWIKDRIIADENVVVTKNTIVAEKTSIKSKEKQQELDIKRITLDIPKHWHRKIKVICAEKGLKMNEEILPLLKSYFKLDD